MAIEFNEIWTKSNRAIKSAYGQTLEEHLSKLFASSLRSKIPMNLRFIASIVDGYNHLITEINNNSDSFILRLRLKMLIEGLHGSLDGASGAKKSLRMMFL